MLSEPKKLPLAMDGARNEERRGRSAGSRYPNAIFTYMRAQIDRFEDGERAVVLPYPAGGRTSDAPRGLLPETAAEGDVFVLLAASDRDETGRLAGENRRALDGLLGDRK